LSCAEREIDGAPSVPTIPRDPKLSVLESNTVEPTIATGAQGDRTDGGVISIRFVSEHHQILHVRQVNTRDETGLSTTYLGFSTCAKGCAAAMRWLEGRDTALAGLEGVYPIELRKDRALSLVFRLEIRDESGIDALRKACHLFIRDVIFTLDDGDRRRLTPIPDAAIGGLTYSEGACRAST
jgi:hypothetical protein